MRITLHSIFNKTKVIMVNFLGTLSLSFVAIDTAITFFTQETNFPLLAFIDVVVLYVYLIYIPKMRKKIKEEEIENEKNS